MKMKSILLLLSCACLAAPAIAQTNGGVAVVDIDAVAKELGIADAVIRDLQVAQTDLNNQLANAKSQLQAKMNQAEAQAGQLATPQQRQELINFNRQLNQEYDRYQANARQILTNTRVTKIREFQDKLKPIAEAEAKKKGLHVVLMKVSPPIFTFTADVDITEEVTAAAKAAGIKADPSPAPVKGTEKGKGTGPEKGAAEKGKGKN